MKKILSFLLAILCLFALCACKEEEHADECTFQATVLEVHQTYLLVEPAEGSWERSSADSDHHFSAGKDLPAEASHQ